MSNSPQAPASSPNNGPSTASWYVDKYAVGHEGVTIDPNRPLQARSEELNRMLGTDALIVATIQAGINGKFAVVDGRDVARLGAPFLLVNGSNPNQIKTILPNSSLTIGRDHHSDQIDYPKDMSRTHFSLGYDSEFDTLHLRDEYSTNGTRVSGNLFSPRVGAPRHKENISASITSVMKTHMEKKPGFVEPSPEAPYGSYMGHPYIGRNSRTVRNSVLAERYSERMIVDDKSEYVKAIVGIVVHGMYQMLARNPNNGQRDLLRHIQKEVADIMQYDLKKTNLISSPHYNNNGVIYMSEYMKAGVGVCRQQAVLAALIMEQAIDEGLLKGSIGVQRNHDYQLNGRHAWAVFRDDQSHAIIVDPAQGFVGTREEAKTLGLWDYYVPDPTD